jgi:hypothetical protein
MSVILQPSVLEKGQVRANIHADEPSLVVDGEHLMWRVPVQFAVLPRGRLGQVGVIDVDAQTGQLHVTDPLIRDMRDHAKAPVERSAA